MAAKGAEAKEYVAKKLQAIFGEDYIGEVDKKYYVWAYEGGQKVQVAIAMTCPKTPIGEISQNNSKTFDWDVTPQNSINTEIPDDERKKVLELMERLGL